MTTKLLQELLHAAHEHGKISEAEHEVGDLQAILFSCWKRLSPHDQKAIYKEHQHIVSDWTMAKVSAKYAK